DHPSCLSRKISQMRVQPDCVCRSAIVSTREISQEAIGMAFDKPIKQETRFVGLQLEVDVFRPPCRWVRQALVPQRATARSTSKIIFGVILRSILWPIRQRRKIGIDRAGKAANAPAFKTGPVDATG